MFSFDWYRVDVGSFAHKLFVSMNLIFIFLVLHSRKLSQYLVALSLQVRRVSSASTRTRTISLYSTQAHCAMVLISEQLSVHKLISFVWCCIYVGSFCCSFAHKFLGSPLRTLELGQSRFIVQKLVVQWFSFPNICLFTSLLHLLGVAFT